MDGPPRPTYDRHMLELPNWREVSLAEFEAFLREYPRPLDIQPPLTQRKANAREWLDVSLGEWPNNAVAKSYRRGRCTGFQVRG